MLLKKIISRFSYFKNSVNIDRYKRYRNKVNAIIRRQKNSAYKQFFCNNNCSDRVNINTLTDLTKYNTIPDDIFYGNNIFNKFERINTFNTFLVE